MPDATTAPNTELRTVALHYAGQPRIINFAHVLGVAGRDKMPGTGKTILDFLKSQGATIRG